MAINPTGAAGVPLTVLGGWVTEMQPSALPEGVSPDLSDVAFLPGSVYSRPCLQKRFANTFPAGGPNGFVPTVVYGKSFITSAGVIKNLFLDSNGALWVEDVTNSPLTYTKLLQTVPGSYGKSITAFGREWIAFSDGLHGTDIAYQWDGTYLDRVTQDGPAAPPMITSLSLPSSTLALASTIPPQTIATITCTDPITQYEGPILGYVTFYTTITITLVGGSTLPVLNQQFSISGGTNPNFDGSFYVVQQITGPLTIKSGFYSATFQTSTLGTISPNSGASLIRSNNTVTGTTATAHGLKVGYQAQITNVAAAVVGSISSIVINNENLPGEATVTTSAAHGLSPELDVTITGVQPVAVGGGISACSRQGQVVTLTMGTAHGLIPGQVITVAGVTDATFNGTFTVQLTPNPNAIVYDQADTDSTSSGGTVSVAWPVPDNTPTPTYFEVLSCPTATTFTIQITYGDGTWTSGSIGFAWNGTFYVTAVPNSTTFQYQQYGPNATTTAMGTVTPFGQCAPGIHLAQVLWLTRQGLVSAPSPPVSFIANGGQYVNVANIPLGPPNVIARIIAFTGAQPNVPGELPPFFYIPVPGQLEGQTVSTATQINDNSTTTTILDFSDNTLFAAIGISIVGNRPANQIVLDGALGFAYFDSRVYTFGQRNCIQNLLNMHFGGGSAFGNPLGWTVPANSVGGAFSVGEWGGEWAVSAGSGDTLGTSGLIEQGAYEDAYGDPIAEPNTLYKVRIQAGSITGTAANLSLVFKLSSVATGFSATATILGTSFSAWQIANFGYFEATFTARTPINIPTDLLLSFYGRALAGTITFQTTEWNLIDAENPWLDNQAFGSYIDNPSAYDGVSGNIQPTEDTKKIMDFSVLRGTPYIHTQDPSGRLHEIIINPTSEPIGWAIREVAANCGALSAFCVTHSQADDQTGAGAEDWTSWASEGGAIVFDGAEPKKVSQEIQPNWNEPFASDKAIQIWMQYATSISSFNDPVERAIYFFLPVGYKALTQYTAPSIMYVLSYRELNGAYAIANSPPFHPSLSGRLIATDNTRKWAPWRLTLNGGARMYASPGGSLTSIFFGGNGFVPGTAVGFGNVYSLNPLLLTDDDYGQVAPYYTTCFFLDSEKAQALGVVAIRIMLAYLNAYITGTGKVTYTFLCDSLDNPWAITTSRTLTSTAKFDQEIGGGMAQGNRIAIRISTTPITGTDNGFNLQRIQGWWKAAKLKLRGAAA